MEFAYADKARLLRDMAKFEAIKADAINTPNRAQHLKRERMMKEAAADIERLAERERKEGIKEQLDEFKL